ncbi:MAG TPA: chaperone modulator CbpM [Gammaproteobacteria bacterium]|jgi:chaperone modulatory protein CbpM|nr:chaperone modulator CbpM [Gammaproteobacteria bacterium]
MADIIEAAVIDNGTLFTLRELCRSSGAHAEVIIEMVEIGLLEPQGRDPADWRFPPQSLARIHSTLRLRRDLEVNLSGAALALDLMDEVARLRRRVRALERQLGE